MLCLADRVTQLSRAGASGLEGICVHSSPSKVVRCVL